MDNFGGKFSFFSLVLEVSPRHFFFGAIWGTSTSVHLALGSEKLVVVEKVYELGSTAKKRRIF